MTDTASIVNAWLIEDHKTYGERLMRALNRIEGIHCAQRFTACEDAFAALTEQPVPDVLLLDVELPGMSGIEGIARLRQLAPKAAVVILDEPGVDDGRCISHGEDGRVMRMVVPWPGAESITTVPPCLRARRWRLVRPMPLPVTAVGTNPRPLS